MSMRVVGYGLEPANANTARTEYGALAIRFTAGEQLYAGELAAQSTAEGANRTAVKCPANADNPLGVVWKDAAPGADVWIIPPGNLAKVKFETDLTPERGFHVYSSASQSGRAGGQAAVNTNRHWGEVGHCLETVAANALALCFLHTN